MKTTRFDILPRTRSGIAAIAAQSPRSRVFMKTSRIAPLRRSVISAVGHSIDQQPAFAFLLSVAKNDPDWESRRTAVKRMGHFQREDAVEELTKIYNSDANIEVKRAAIAIAGGDKESACASASA